MADPARMAEMLASMANQARELLQPAYDGLEGLADIHEGVAARMGIRRMLKFTASPISVGAFISEARNALIPARYHLCKVSRLPQAEAARIAIQKLLDFIAACAAECDCPNAQA